MKKLLYSAFILAAGILASCDDTDLGGPKNDPGATATVALAGEWYVHMDGIDAQGNVVENDPYGAGDFELLTYNTAADDATKMFVDDQGKFWDFKGEVNCDVNALTFSGSNITNLSYEGMTFEVLGGKILLGAATSPFGHKVDSICFDVKFSDDEYIGIAWNAMRFSGYRRTGFDQGAE